MICDDGHSEFGVDMLQIKQDSRINCFIEFDKSSVELTSDNKLNFTVSYVRPFGNDDSEEEDLFMTFDQKYGMMYILDLPDSRRYSAQHTLETVKLHSGSLRGAIMSITSLVLMFSASFYI